MPKRKEQFNTNGIYHLIIKALDDNLIFKDENDYFRGIFSIYEFNNSNPVEIWRRRRDRVIEKKREKFREIGNHKILLKDERDKFVEILAFSFMPNHIHILVRQVKDNGISKFMQKVGIGLGKYFNAKYQRKGHVFQDAFKAVSIENDEQLIAVVNYIHGNAISLIEPGWKKNGIKNHKKTIKFLEEKFRWSSFFDCIGKENFSSVTERNFILKLLDGTENYKNLMRDWINYKKIFQNNGELFLEE